MIFRFSLVMYKFTGFSEKANRALNCAVETAENMGHTYIGSEHLLMGLVKEDAVIATELVSANSVTFQKIESVVKNAVGVGIPTALCPDDFTPRCRKIIDFAIFLSRSEGEALVGTQHLLCASAKEEDSTAAKILRSLSVDFETILNFQSKQQERSSSVFSQKDNKSNSKLKTPNLDLYGTNLVKKAQNGQIDPVIARDSEIERVIQILSRRTKNNPCLIGEPGVGKTAIAEALAVKIANADVPEILQEKKVISLDLTSIVAGTKYRGDFEERIKNCIGEVVKAGDIILFIDELHNLIGTGSAEGAVDAANILKPSLARSEIQIIGATTIKEYRKYIEKDSALERRFQSVLVEEPTKEETVEIIKGLREKYELHHKVKITDEAITAAVEMSVRYITDRFLPDKAIDLIDEAASKVRLRSFVTPPHIKQSEKKLKNISDEKSRCVDNQDFEKAAKLRDKEKAMLYKLSIQKATWKEESSNKKGEVGSKEIAQIVSAWTKIPVNELTKAQKQRLLEIEKELHKKIVGQEKAVSAVSRAIRRGRSGLKDPNRPIGSFIFLGPTGVGKTQLCKALGEVVFLDSDSLIRFDMSEFMEKHNASRLLGSPPGYVGYDEGGQLTEKIRRKPYSVVLFDEIEKAHADVFNILLQILDEGFLTDSQGRKVDFRNAIIIITSNIGAKLISGDSRTIGFGAEGKNGKIENSEVYDAVMKELKNTFKIEFLNRIDEIIIFERLSEKEIEQITEKLLAKLRERLDKMKIKLHFDSAVIKQISKDGYDSVYGARALKREIQTKIEDPLTEAVLQGEIEEKGEYICKMRDSKTIFEKVTKEEKIEI